MHTKVDIEQIKANTTRDGVVKMEDLSFLTPEFVENHRTKSTIDGNVKRGRYVANSFFIDEHNVWNWQYSPGDPCGAQIQVSMQYRSGMTHVQSGLCIGGLKTYDIVVP